MRKLRQYPAGYGSMCYGQTEANDAMAGEAFKLLRALGYRGLGSLEFKYRQRDGGYYFIEMNTRLPWYNGIFADAGVNLAHLAYVDLAGNHPGKFMVNLSRRPAQRNGITWVGYHNFRSWYRESKNPRPVSLGKFVASVAHAKSYAWWNWRGSKPFLASGFLAARRLAGKSCARPAAIIRRIRVLTLTVRRRYALQTLKPAW